jgi:hypothetical protein
MASVTAPVAAARTPNMATGNLTHLCILSEDNAVVGTYCRVKPSSILDDMSMWTQDRPTCPVCAKHWSKR